MRFKYTGDIKDRNAFGYDFSNNGECEVDNEHFANKVKNLPNFEIVNFTAITKDVPREASEVDELREELTKRNIKFKLNNSVKTLQKLLEQDNDEIKPD